MLGQVSRDEVTVYVTKPTKQNPENHANKNPLLNKGNSEKLMTVILTITKY